MNANTPSKDQENEQQVPMTDIDKFLDECKKLSTEREYVRWTDVKKLIEIVEAQKQQLMWIADRRPLDGDKALIAAKIGLMRANQIAGRP